MCVCVCPSKFWSLNCIPCAWKASSTFYCIVGLLAINYLNFVCLKVFISILCLKNVFPGLRSIGFQSYVGYKTESNKWANTINKETKTVLQLPERREEGGLVKGTGVKYMGMEVWLWVGDTHCNIQSMYLKSIYLISQSHPYKFNKIKKEKNSHFHVPLFPKSYHETRERSQ